MCLTASSKPRKKPCAYEKMCAYKVCLTTRVYGIMYMEFEILYLGYFFLNGITVDRDIFAGKIFRQ